jgi:outer membrane protein assembly factor BamD
VVRIASTALALALLAAGIGCASDTASSAPAQRDSAGQSDGAKSARLQHAKANPTSRTEFASDAQANLDKGNDALRTRSYLDAEKYFEYVKTKYPFLDVAKEAEIRLADTDFERERYTEARDRYQNFVKLHPTHPKVDYAAYRAALTHYKDMPSEFFILPPAKEKDQAEVRAANKAMADFVRSYPSSTYFPEAKKILDDTRKRLAEHELYVAEFYSKRKKWAAVAQRLETVADKYSGLGYDEKVLFELHDVYGKLNDKSRAEDALRKIISRFPGTPAASKAQQMLGS